MQPEVVVEAIFINTSTAAQIAEMTKKQQRNDAMGKKRSITRTHRTSNGDVKRRENESAFIELAE